MSAPALTVYVNGAGSLTGDGLNTMVQSCDTFAQLRTLVGVSGVEVSVRGQTVPGDGLGGIFYWSSLSTASDDDLTVLMPIGGAYEGRWLLLPVSGGALLGNYPNDTAAAAGGVQVGAFYRNGSSVQVRIS